MTKNRKGYIPTLLIGICLFSSALLPAVAEPSEDQLSGTELYKTCFDKPEFEQCQGIKVSEISIKDQLGTQVGCGRQSCKIELKPDRLIVHIKHTKQLTETIEIAFDQILLADLQFWKYIRTSSGGLLRPGTTNRLYVPEPQAYQEFIEEFEPQVESPDERPRRTKRTLLEIHYLTASPSFAGNRSQKVFIMSKSGFGIHLKEAIAASHSRETTHQLLQQIRPGNNAIGDLPQNHSDLKAQLLETKSCVGCDLRSIDLSEQDLTASNLEGANLSNANLKGTQLKFSNLVGANLSNAMMDEADLKFANLLGATLDDSSLIKARMSHTVMQHTSLQRANLSQARMKGAMLDYADLQQANLSEIDLDRAEFVNVRYFKKKPKENPVHGSDVIRMAFIRHANLEGANFSGARLEKVRFNHSHLSQSNFTDAKFNQTYFFNADLTGAIFKPSSPKKVRLCSTILPDGSISNTDCPDAN